MFHLAHEAAMVEVGGEDAEPVPAALELGAVRVEHAERERLSRGPPHHHDPVAPHALETVADPRDGPRMRGPRVPLLEDEVVVAEPVGLVPGGSERRTRSELLGQDRLCLRDEGTGVALRVAGQSGCVERAAGVERGPGLQIGRAHV